MEKFILSDDFCLDISQNMIQVVPLMRCKPEGTQIRGVGVESRPRFGEREQTKSLDHFVPKAIPANVVPKI